MWIDPQDASMEASLTAQDLALTGLDLMTGAVVATLDAALLTDAELEQGAAAGRGWRIPSRVARFRRRHAPARPARLSAVTASRRRERSCEHGNDGVGVRVVARREPPLRESVGGGEDRRGDDVDIRTDAAGRADCQASRRAPISVSAAALSIAAASAGSPDDRARIVSSARHSCRRGSARTSSR
jgi:hypothetical protein